MKEYNVLGAADALSINLSFFFSIRNMPNTSVTTNRVHMTYIYIYIKTGK